MKSFLTSGPGIKWVQLHRSLSTLAQLVDWYSAELITKRFRNRITPGEWCCVLEEGTKSSLFCVLGQLQKTSQNDWKIVDLVEKHQAHSARTTIRTVLHQYQLYQCIYKF